MSTYLLTWNPKRTPRPNAFRHDLGDLARQTRKGKPFRDTWSCGNRKTIPLGSRLFLIRQGKEPKGIFASGESVSPVWEDDHWDGTAKKRANYVKVVFDRLIDPDDPEATLPLPISELQDGKLGEVHWFTESSGIEIPEDAAVELERLWKQHFHGSSTGQITDDKALVVIGEHTTMPDDDANPPPSVVYTTTRVVRNTAKGDMLKRLYGCRCQVCSHRCALPGNDGAGYSEVHHLRPLGGDHRGFDNPNNMLVLCPNCHAEFDFLAMAIDPKTLRVVSFHKQNRKKGGKLFFRLEHKLAKENIEYQWRRFCEAAAPH